MLGGLFSALSAVVGATPQSEPGSQSVSLVPQIGHSETINAVAYSPDGTQIATASDDGSVRLWDRKAREVRAVLSGHEDRVNSVAYSPDGQYIVSSSMDGTVRVWDSARATAVATMEATAHSAAYSPDGRRIVSGGLDDSVRVWDAAAHAELAGLTGHEGSVMSVVYSPDGEQIASGSSDGTIRIWDSTKSTEIRVHRGHNDWVLSVAYSPDGQQVASASRDNTIRIWDADTGAEISVFKGHDRDVVSVAYRPDGRHIVSGSRDGSVRVWDAASGDTVAILQGGDGVAYSPDGRLIASGTVDGTVQVTNARTGKPISNDVERSPGSISAVRFNGRGDRVVAAIELGSIWLWDSTSGVALRTLRNRTYFVERLAFSPDDSLVAGSGGPWAGITVWDVETAELVEFDESISAVAYSPDGNRLASASRNGAVRIWDAKSGEVVGTSEGHRSRALAVTFSPDGSRIASGGFDDTVRVWDAENASEVARLEGHSSWIYSVSYSPDGRHLASGSQDGTVRIWDVATAEGVAILSGHEDGVRSVAFSPDGQWIASGGDDATIRLWHVATASEAAILEGHDGWIWSVAYSPDGAGLVSASLDGTVRVWDTVTRRPIAILNEHARAVAYSPNGGVIAYGSSTGEVLVWNAKSKDVVGFFRGHESTVTGVTFSPDGTRMASGSADWTIRIWSLSDEENHGILSGVDDWVRSFASGKNSLSDLQNHCNGINIGGHEYAWPYSQRVACSETQVASGGGSGVLSIADTGGANELLFQVLPSDQWITYRPDHATYISSENAADLVRVRFDSPECPLFRFLGSRICPLYPLDWYENKLRKSPGYFQDQPEATAPIHQKEIRMIMYIITPTIMPFATPAVAVLASFFVTFYYFRQRNAERRRSVRGHSDPVVRDVRTFLEEAGATASSLEDDSLLIIRAPAALQAHTPVPVVITGEAATERHVRKLVAHAKHAQEDLSERVGLLIYREAPEALARLEMGAVRLRDRFSIVPIPYAEVTRALRSSEADRLLVRYSELYLPGSNLFDYRNSISDALTFFGRTHLLQRLRADLTKSRQSVGLFGLRKSGKTSVLLQLRSALHRGNPAYAAVYCDLQYYGERDTFGSDIYNSIVSQLCDIIASRTGRSRPRFAPFPSDMPCVRSSVEFSHRVEKLAIILSQSGIALPMLCFLDEVERILPRMSHSAGRIGEYNSFFGTLRALCQQQRVLALLVTDVFPDCNRINHWPQRDAASNPIYSFLTEVFLGPFSEEDTVAMISDIGDLMGRRLDAETARAIHRESGGHPFVARQIASIVCSEVSTYGDEPVTWKSAQSYVEDPFRESPKQSLTLQTYCDAGIMGELEKRGFVAADAILRLLASREVCENVVTEDALSVRVGALYTESQWLSALVWLEATGLVRREEICGGLGYRVTPLVGRWLQMDMAAEELKRWRTL